MFKVDLDYEASLFDLNYNENSKTNKKVIREFEYVFFIINKEEAALKNYKNYDEKYLSKLKSLGFFIPEFEPNCQVYLKWWGNHHDRQLEILLNSKLTSAELAKKNSWGFWEGAIVESIEEVYAHLRKFPTKKKWIIKHPYSFSGRGHFQIDSEHIDEDRLAEKITEKYLLEPVYDRLFDIGSTYIVEDGEIKSFFMVENFNSPQGGFRGGLGASNLQKFKKYIYKNYSYSLDELEANTLEIAKLYLRLGAVGNIQIDSFIYRDSEQGNLKLYSLVEVNYRKTMGLVINSLAKKFNKSEYIQWRIETSKSLKENPLDSNWIKISPEGNNFQSFFRCY